MTQRASPQRLVRLTVIVLIAVCSVLFVSPAFADVRLEGAWPDAEKSVSLEAEGMARSRALRQLADTMGWSIVLHAPSSEPVDLQVKDQPASKILSMLLSDDDYVARREGTLIAIEPVKPAVAGASARAAPPAIPEATASSPRDPPSAPATPIAMADARDRVVTGGKVRVEKGEVVRDVVVFGGSTDVLGTTTGDVTVIGGSARIHAGAHVMGDATAIGGSLDVEDGASVDGDVGVVGGTLRRGENARIGGNERANVPTARNVEAQENGGLGGWFAGVMASIASAIASAALLFVFGAMLLALATHRMDSLQSELAARPMRSFALGVVGLLVFALLAVAFTLTLVGIPIVVIGSVLGVVAAYAGICAVLTVAGASLIRHKTSNPYVHLALGCLLFMVAKALPFVGDLVLIAVILLGIGTLVATRGAGFVPPRHKPKAARVS